jgi:phage/plasmid-associated DNA primase
VVPFLENFEDRANKHLARELLAELPGILNWALAGLKDWHTHGLGTCQAVECATQDYKADQDKIGRWLGECTVQAPQAVVSVQDAWNSYKRWCDDSNVFAGSKKAWVSELAQRGYESQKLQHKRQYIGIGLMPEDDSGTEGTEGTVNHGSTREQNSPKEKPENASLASLASPDDTEPDKAGEEPPYTGGDMPPADTPDTHQTAQDIRLQVVGAIKAGNDDALARLLPRLRAISERAYLEVCAKYGLHNQEQRQ